jgi:fused signal recognition particle receptor
MPAEEAGEEDGPPSGPEAEKRKGWFGRLREKFSSGPSEDAPAGTGEAKAEDPLSAAASQDEDLAPAGEAPVETGPAGDQPPDLPEAGLASGAGPALPAATGPSGETPPGDARGTDSPADDATGPSGETPPGDALDEKGEIHERKVGWFGRLKQKLASTRDKLAGRLETVLSATRTIDDDVLDELEEILITSDLGVKTSSDILSKIRGQVARKELNDVEALKASIRTRISEMVMAQAKPPVDAKPFVTLVVGVNGVGKTTTIAKLARIHQNEGRKVILAAGDTFRAAAVEQLSIWAQRLGVPIISQPTGADASAVVFDALTAAKARGADVVLIDTAGRLHTKTNLMDELKKIRRVAAKAIDGAPHETILVLDANTGQNAASQAKIFNESIGVDSLIVTKLDGTSKGGVIVSIINEEKLPIKYIGIGETLEDLRPFEPEAFVEAIMGPR